MLISIAKAHELTGKAWRTIQRRVNDAGVKPEGQERNAPLYESKSLLEAIYKPEVPQGLDLSTERAALAQAQRLRIERQMQIDAGELVRADDVLTAWAGHIGTAKQRLLALPATAAGLVAPGRTAEAEAILRKLVREALEELSGTGSPSTQHAQGNHAAGKSGE